MHLVNHLQIQVRAGVFAVTWNSRGKLTRIDWYDHSPNLATYHPDQAWALVNHFDLPRPIHKLLGSFRRFFEAGEPIGQIPWDWIDQEGWTEFQSQVFHILSTIPHGETRTYAWVARKTGQIGGSRAVGQALRRNPIPILIPCHRVVASSALGGFMGVNDPEQPELKLKKWLIDLETRFLEPYFSFIPSTPEYQLSAQPTLFQ